MPPSVENNSCDTLENNSGGILQNNSSLEYNSRGTLENNSSVENICCGKLENEQGLLYELFDISLGLRKFASKASRETSCYA